VTTLRLEWPQWQGGEPQAVAHYTPGLDVRESREVYGLGGELAAFLAPPADGPMARVTVPAYVADLPVVDGIVGKQEVLRQHHEALGLIRKYDPDRIVTLGGTCAVSLTPLSYLAERYTGNLAVIWLDSHADSNLPGGPNCGLNTMVVSHLCGRGDTDVLASLPGTVATDHLLLAGVHGWDDQDSHTHEAWGLHLIAPAPQPSFVDDVLAWVRGTGAQQVAIHFDLDVINSNEHAFGMAWEKDGISKTTALATIVAVAEEFDLVGLTVAEFVPREAIVLRSMLRHLPLVAPTPPQQS
jgi:arginase